MTRYLLLAALALIVALPGCGKEDNAAPSTPGTSNADSMMGAVKQMASSIDTSKYTAQLSAVDTQVEKLKSMAKDKADAELSKLLGQVGDKLDAAQKKLSSLKDAEGGTAEALKKELDNLMPELQKLLDKAVAKANELGVSV